MYKQYDFSNSPSLYLNSLIQYTTSSASFYDKKTSLENCFWTLSQNTLSLPCAKLISTRRDGNVWLPNYSTITGKSHLRTNKGLNNNFMERKLWNFRFRMIYWIDRRQKEINFEIPCKWRLIKYYFFFTIYLLSHNFFSVRVLSCILQCICINLMIIPLW